MREPEHIGLLRDTLRRFVGNEMPAEARQRWDREHSFPFGERHVRDILGMPIVGGSSNMQRDNLANRLGLAG